VTSKPRPKVQAAGTATGVVVGLAYLLRLVGIDVDGVPPEVLLAAGGALATGAAYLKRDGLAGTWDRIVHGERVS
jgi:hypothetical protein